MKGSRAPWVSRPGQAQLGRDERGHRLPIARRRLALSSHQRCASALFDRANNPADRRQPVEHLDRRKLERLVQIDVCLFAILRGVAQHIRLALDLAAHERFRQRQAALVFVGAQLRALRQGHAGQAAGEQRAVVVAVVAVQKVDRNALLAAGAHHIAAEADAVADDQQLFEMHDRRFGQALLVFFDPQPALVFRDE